MKVMNNKFDELAKGLAQSVTGRAAFKKFAVGLAGIALAYFGMADKAVAGHCERSAPIVQRAPAQLTAHTVGNFPVRFFSHRVL
jgi:hypothetical protein